MTPDWTTAPPGATHYHLANNRWDKYRGLVVHCWFGGEWALLKYAPINDRRHFMERPE